MERDGTAPPPVATTWLLAQVRVMLAQPWLAEDEEAVRTWFDTLVLHAVLTDDVRADDVLTGVARTS